MVFWVGGGHDHLHQPCLGTQDGQLFLFSRMCFIMFSSLPVEKRILFSNTVQSFLSCSFPTMSALSFMAWSALLRSSTSRSSTQEKPWYHLPFQAEVVHDLCNRDEFGPRIAINIISVHTSKIAAVDIFYKKSWVLVHSNGSKVVWFWQLILWILFNLLLVGLSSQNGYFSDICCMPPRTWLCPPLRLGVWMAAANHWGLLWQAHFLICQSPSPGVCWWSCLTCAAAPGTHSSSTSLKYGDAWCLTSASWPYTWTTRTSIVHLKKLLSTWFPWWQQPWWLSSIPDWGCPWSLQQIWGWSQHCCTHT